MKIPIIKCDPVITPDIFEAFTEGGDAIIIEAFATGQVPLRLTAAMKARVDEGIPVFFGG